MWAFKLRLARLTTTLDFITTKNDSYWRLGMAARGASACPTDHFLTLHPPNSKSYQPIFVFFFQKMCRLFLVRYWKARKDQAISVFDIDEKHEGGGNLPRLPGRGLTDLDLHMGQNVKMSVIIEFFVPNDQ